MAKEVVVRKESGWKVISILPDVCKTPMGPSIPPVPYPVYAELQDAVAMAKSVRSNGHPLVVFDMSKAPDTIGDGAGQAKGIKSNTVQSRCYPAEHSGSVRAQKHFTVRHNDLFDMNAP